MLKFTERDNFAFMSIEDRYNLFTCLHIQGDAEGESLLTADMLTIATGQQYREKLQVAQLIHQRPLPLHHNCTIYIDGKVAVNDCLVVDVMADYYRKVLKSKSDRRDFLLLLPYVLHSLAASGTASFRRYAPKHLETVMIDFQFDRLHTKLERYTFA